MRTTTINNQNPDHNFNLTIIIIIIVLLNILLMLRTCQWPPRWATSCQAALPSHLSLTWAPCRWAFEHDNFKSCRWDFDHDNFKQCRWDFIMTILNHAGEILIMILYHLSGQWDSIMIKSCQWEFGLYCDQNLNQNQESQLNLMTIDRKTFWIRTQTGKSMNTWWTQCSSR